MVLSWAGLAVAWGLSVAGVEEGGGSAFSRPSGFTDASRKKKNIEKVHLFAKLVWKSVYTGRADVFIVFMTSVGRQISKDTSLK